MAVPSMECITYVENASHARLPYDFSKFGLARIILRRKELWVHKVKRMSEHSGSLIRPSPLVAAAGQPWLECVLRNCRQAAALGCTLAEPV